MSFPDHFSGHAEDYARARPSYPAELFDWLAAVAPARGLAWDCATGNGQAALELGARFARVVGTDGSSEQLRRAAPRPGLDYARSLAERVALKAGTVDLCTVAQAAHWFDVPAFSREVERVGRPDTVLCVWCYTLFRVSPAVDAVVDELYGPILRNYWPAGRHHIETEYRELALPGVELDAPAFSMRRRWIASQALADLGTWSSAARYLRAHGRDPLGQIEAPLRSAWGAGEREVVWPLHLRCTRLET